MIFFIVVQPDTQEYFAHTMTANKLWVGPCRYIGLTITSYIPPWWDKPEYPEKTFHLWPVILINSTT